LEWAPAVWERGEEELESYEGFIALFKCIFDHPAGREGGERLLQIQQGNQTAAEYAFTFRTVAASSGWKELALSTLFRKDLREEVQTELVCRDDNLTLDALIAPLGASASPSLLSLLRQVILRDQSLNPWR
jgi:hypothetical protein